MDKNIIHNKMILETIADNSSTREIFNNELTTYNGSSTPAYYRATLIIVTLHHNLLEFIVYNFL